MELRNIILITIAGFTLSHARYGKYAAPCPHLKRSIPAAEDGIKNNLPYEIDHTERSQAGDTRIPLPRKSLGHLQKNCRLQSWTLYKSADCR